MHEPKAARWTWGSYQKKSGSHILEYRSFMLALSLWPRLMKTSTLQLKRCFKLFYLSVLLEKVLILWTHHNILKKKSHRWACIFVSIAMHYSVKIKYLLKRSCSTTVLFFKLLTPYFMEIVFSFFFLKNKFIFHLRMP